MKDISKGEREREKRRRRRRRRTRRRRENRVRSSRRARNYATADEKRRIPPPRRGNTPRGRGGWLI
jgi:hypothetical protein